MIGRIRLKEIDGLKKDQLFKHVKQYDANANGQRCMVVEPYLLTRNIDYAVEEEEEEVSHQKYNFENPLLQAIFFRIFYALANQVMKKMIKLFARINFIEFGERPQNWKKIYFCKVSS